MGEPLDKFRLYPSASGTETALTKEIREKKELSGRPPCKILAGQYLDKS